LCARSLGGPSRRQSDERQDAGAAGGLRRGRLHKPKTKLELPIEQKTLGKEITTRMWETVVKVAK
jgi:hypothetical protein